MLLSEPLPFQGQVHENLYQTWMPPPPLNQWVHYLWQLDIPAGEYSYRSVPDNCVDLIFNLNDLNDAIFVSPFKSAIVYPLIGPIRYFGVRFRLLGQHVLLPETIGEWSSTSHQIPINNLLPPPLIGQFQESLSFDEGFTKRCLRFSKAMMEHVKRPSIDARVLKFVRYCYQPNSHLFLKDLAPQQLGITDRQLRRLTQQYLGVSPKTFCKILAFQSTVRAWQTQKDKMAWADWYFDQSHFSRDFNQLAGVSPKQFFNMSVLYNSSSLQSRIILPDDNA